MHYTYYLGKIGLKDTLKNMKEVLPELKLIE